MCRLNGYCKSSKKQNEGKCRFGYPIAVKDKTSIEFMVSGNKVKAEIKLKNAHNRLITHNWRATLMCKFVSAAKN